MSSTSPTESQEIVQLKFYELENGKASKLIEEYQSFEVIDLNEQMKEAILILESLIEKRKMTCRVYTLGRSAAVAGSFFGGITGLIGIASTVAIAAHNLVTLNPEYEIAKNKISKKLTVTAKHSRLSSHIKEKNEKEKIKEKMNSFNDKLEEDEA